MVRLLHKIFQKQSITRLSIWICKRGFRITTLQQCHEHTVIVSKSNNIYTNLALEEWLYENEDLSKKSILLLWKNQPTVVIGRHQNPWLECNVEEIVDSGIDLVRRSSGGGTVYHDEGNLNCSFIKERKLYNRKWNLDLVVSAVTSAWDVDLSLNSREDIVLDKLYKVSGTASKLGRDKTYHHFTLLYNVDTEKLSYYLNSPLATVGVKSKATQSLPSVVKNISDYVDVDFTSLVSVIGHQFLNSGHSSKENEINWLFPDDKLYPGLRTITDRLQDWEWIYGKTPKFTIDKTFTKMINSEEKTLKICIEISRGRISDIDIDLAPIMCQSISGFIQEMTEKLINVKFWRMDLDPCIHAITNNEEYSEDFDICEWILICLKNALLYKC